MKDEPEDQQVEGPVRFYGVLLVDSKIKYGKIFKRMFPGKRTDLTLSALQ